MNKWSWQNIVILVALFLLGNRALAQSSFVTSDEDFYHIIDRYSILNASKLNYATSIKPIDRKLVNDIQYLLNGSGMDQISVFTVNTFNADFLLNETWEVGTNASQTGIRNPKGVVFQGKEFPHFYARRGSFFSVEEPDFKLVVNPVFGLDAGQDREDGSTVFRNTRGAELRGSIGNKVGFYSFLSENQFRYPSFYNQWIDEYKVVPGAGFIKNFGSNAKDFLVSRGYITVSPIEQIKVQFGHDRNFIGNGYRSLIMSDFAKENLFLKLQTKVWRITYVNLFSEYADFQSRSSTGLKKKYGAFHYFNFNVIPGKLDIGMFEHIIFYRDNGGFETQYLNPIIFYRSVEHGINSVDNAILGMDWKWNPKNNVSLYGQFVLDEFYKNELIKRTGAWVNKWAFQAGAKWINAFKVKNLDVQVETNNVRPYTYTHKLIAQNYMHYNQAIAHPIGANFKEVLAIVRYQPKPKWNVVLKVFNILHGADSSVSDPTTHFGGDLLKDYEHRPKDTGIKIGDGVKENIQILDACVSYQIYHRTYFDLRYVYRNAQKEAPLVSQRSSLVYLGFRMNLAKMSFDF